MEQKLVVKILELILFDRGEDLVFVEPTHETWLVVINGAKTAGCHTITLHLLFCLYDPHLTFFTFHNIQDLHNLRNCQNPDLTLK